MNIEKENTVTIDPTTGLPALPKGYFWRVAAIRDSYSRLTCYRVQIMYKTTKTVFPDRKHWWSFQEPAVEVATEHVKAYGTVKDAAKVAKRAENLLAWEAEHGKDEGYGFYHSKGHVDVIAKHLTKEDVLTAAHEALKQWADSDEAKAKQLASDALLGDYPPKVLP